MENASKALIIAGAILLSILIISLGIMIYQQAAGVVNQDAMTEVEINSFNQKFEQYFGENVRGANVNALINAVNANNRSTDDESRKVKINGAAANSSNAKNYKTGKTYKVSEDGLSSGGLISNIKIEEKQ